MILTLDETAKGVSIDKEIEKSPGMPQHEEEVEELERRRRRDSNEEGETPECGVSVESIFGRKGDHLCQMLLICQVK